MIIKREFGTTHSGEPVYAYDLTDGGNVATVITYGAILQRLVVPDRAGKPTGVLLGQDCVAGYEDNGGCLGAIIGRFANRIQNGKFSLEGKEITLTQNERGNHKHGGAKGFNKRVWQAEAQGDTLLLTYLSKDGEEGYPGSLKTEVRYSLKSGELKISYRAVSDKTTVVNLTNHAYFNLNGEGNGDILNNELQIFSDYISPTDEEQIPVGGFLPVAGTPFDFTCPKEIGRDIGKESIDLKYGNGYDHSFLLRGKGYRLFAVARGKQTGIAMECYTDLPAVQFYSGNGLHQEGRKGYYGARTGFCLETQLIPNNVNVPEYAEKGSSVLRAGEVFASETAYRFFVK